MHAWTLFFPILYICFISVSTSGHRRWDDKDCTSLSCVKKSSVFVLFSETLLFFHTEKRHNKKGRWPWESNLCYSPLFLPFSAATSCLAGSLGQCARLTFTTVPKSASASPTTWGLGGINQSPSDMGGGAKRQIRTSPESWRLLLELYVF